MIIEFFKTKMFDVNIPTRLCVRRDSLYHFDLFLSFVLRNIKRISLDLEGTE
jgi:hypothetical protein